MNKQNVDVLIIGGGLVGATLLLALRRLGYRSLLIEAKPWTSIVSPPLDARSLALSPASQRILNSLDLWSSLKAKSNPIDMIHVSEKQAFGATRLYGTSTDPLGYVIEMQVIQSTLATLINEEERLTGARLIALDLPTKTAQIESADGPISIEAQLIVAADGAHSTVRQCCNLGFAEIDYQQEAIVANLGLAQPHQNRAFERFSGNSSLALLPLQAGRMSMIWAKPSAQAKQLMSLAPSDFLKAFQAAFGYRLGRFTQIGQRFAYPLKQITMPKQAQWPVIFIGNAAHTLHPIAGQGFNLGLRDVAMLAQCIVNWGFNPVMMNHYLQQRQSDQKVITGFTDGLVRLFANSFPGFSLLRSLGLMTFEHVTPLRNLLAHYAQGFGGIVPDLVCGITLRSSIDDKTL